MGVALNVASDWFHPFLSAQQRLKLEINYKVVKTEGAKPLAVLVSGPVLYSILGVGLVCGVSGLHMQRCSGVCSKDTID